MASVMAIAESGGSMAASVSAKAIGSHQSIGEKWRWRRKMAARRHSRWRK